MQMCYTRLHAWCGAVLLLNEAAAHGTNRSPNCFWCQGISTRLGCCVTCRRMCRPIEQPAAAAVSPRAAQPPGGESTDADVGGDTIYRLASVGQDCQLLLWDVVVSEDVLAAVPGGPRQVYVDSMLFGTANTVCAPLHSVGMRSCVSLPFGVAGRDARPCLVQRLWGTHCGVSNGGILV